LVVDDDHASILHGYGDTGLQKFWGHDFDLLRSRDVIGHVTIGLGVRTFLLVVNDDHASILHRYGDTGLQRFWGHEFDLLGLRVNVLLNNITFCNFCCLRCASP